MIFFKMKQNVNELFCKSKHYGRCVSTCNREESFLSQRKKSPQEVLVHKTARF